jgi:peptide/nickel transport system substrate-binding protein
MQREQLGHELFDFCGSRLEEQAKFARLFVRAIPVVITADGSKQIGTGRSATFHDRTRDSFAHFETRHRNENHPGVLSVRGHAPCFSLNSPGIYGRSLSAPSLSQSTTMTQARKLRALYVCTSEPSRHESGRPRRWTPRGMLLVLSVLAWGCAPQKAPDERGVMTVVPQLRASWVRNFNPFFESHSRWPTLAGIYEPLLIYNRISAKYLPWLAESWFWTNENRTLVLRIRRGVKFSDGQTLTPRDVAFTLELMRRFPALDQTSIWAHLARLSTRNDEVELHFKRPFTLPILALLERVPIVPEHIWSQIDDPVKFANPEPIATGPYSRVLYFSPQLYELGKNPNYWQPGKPGLDKIRVPAIGSNEAQALALIHGEVDWGAAFLPSVERIFVQKDPEHHQYQFPSLEGTVMLYANTKRAPFETPAVRKALSLAIDRQKIVRIAMQGYTRAADATGLSDQFATWRDPKVLEEEGDWTRFDPARAAHLLDEAGLKKGPDGLRRLPNGEPWRTELNAVVGWSDWIISAQIIVKNLRALGVDVRLRTYDQGAWFQRLRMGDFDLSLSWSNGTATPWSFYQYQMSKDTLRPLGEPAERNWQRFESERADALLNAFAESGDPEERFRLSSDLQREFVRMAPAIPLFPGPIWGEANTKRIVGFPSQDAPYAPLAPYKAPGMLLVLTELRPRGTPPLPGTPGAGAPGRGELIGEERDRELLLYRESEPQEHYAGQSAPPSGETL